MKNAKDRWSKWRRRDGSIDFDALPHKLKHEFAHEDENAPGTPLNDDDIARHERSGLHPRRGRPRVGEGAVRVQANIEASLLRRLDSYAKAKGISRSRVLCEGAKFYLSRVA